MNIQGPLLLLGMTATTGVGLGTVAVNSGAIDIEDVSGLLADTTNAVSGPVAGAANPFGQSASLASPQITASGIVPVLDTSLAPVATDGASGGSITAYDPGTTGTSSGTNSGSSHGTSSGSTGGSSGSNSGNNSGASNGTNSGSSHGTSSGSTGGSSSGSHDDDYEDEDEDDDHEDNDHEDHEDHEDDGDDD